MSLENGPKNAIGNRRDLARSEVAGCYYCESIFNPVEIKDWVDEGQTALCPMCGIDSVLASATGYEIDPELLKRFHKRFFERSKFLPG